MKRFVTGIALLALICCQWAQGKEPQIIPAVNSYAAEEGVYVLPPSLSAGQDRESLLTNIRQNIESGIIKVHTSESQGATTADGQASDEGYTLTIKPSGIEISAEGDAGVIYAVETLAQIINQTDDGTIDACIITDSPRMAYRGLMLDVTRCYLPIDEIKKIVDIAGSVKLNKVHLHLTDDNGWRMEINKYPKLTAVGAWRVDRDELFPGRANPKAGEPTNYGGYYTQAQLRDLVAYAAERHIDIIPEIEMPAHAVAAIASYPELACPVDNGFVGVLPGIGGPAASIIMCAGGDNTLQFVKDVLDEVMDVFPGQYIHLGGDEANKSHWEKCPKCQARKAELGLEDFEQLQAWFMDSVSRYVQQHGRTAIGWDEVTYGHPNKDMVIMGWQGDGSVAVNYAKDTGSRFIMTPAQKAYLIRYQGPQWFEPFTYFGNITLRDAYFFEPVQDDWTDALTSQMMGIQGSMWTEFCREPSDVQYQIFPRIFALADVAWRPKDTHDWEGFVEAVEQMGETLDREGIDWSRAMYNVQHTVRPAGLGMLTLEAETIHPKGTVVMDTKSDFSEMINPSILGLIPWGADLDTEVTESDVYYLKAQTSNGREGRTLKLPIHFTDATGATVRSDNCSNAYIYVLTNGVRGSKRNSDFEWAGWYNRPASFAIDLEEPTEVKSLKIGTLANANMIAGFPEEIRVYAADSTGQNRLIGVKRIPENERFPLDATIRDIAVDIIPTTAVGLIIEADNAGAVPAGYPREGTNSWIYFDEVLLNEE